MDKLEVQSLGATNYQWYLPQSIPAEHHPVCQESEYTMVLIVEVIIHFNKKVTSVSKRLSPSTSSSAGFSSPPGLKKNNILNFWVEIFQNSWILINKICFTQIFFDLDRKQYKLNDTFYN